MDGFEFFGGVIGVIVLIVLIIAIIVFTVAVHESAKNRGRNAGGWTFLALFVTPILCLFALHILGETKKKREERIVEEEFLKIRIREEYSSESSNTD
jgi:NADH:ubiquinone oxidoreductase subunit 6 (subunit J)